MSFRYTIKHKYNENNLFKALEYFSRHNINALEKKNAWQIFDVKNKPNNMIGHLAHSLGYQNQKGKSVYLFLEEVLDLTLEEIKRIGDCLTTYMVVDVLEEYKNI